ncbi:MauE/DoxX family redox-associated membrane protein [Streptomyces zingiberis]|uniref:DoxX family membrane protein n=1 Tax=Streptomyces zingiberis TaxID=2053010 RepID=A0ABX1BU46_9ACTN|nr:MauE/DoxX family redox-associated membrane protein [Streptomyces zingiberis]NJQ01244.1 DoxX family membrane protein [Streptomyces zingiberis]
MNGTGQPAVGLTAAAATDSVRTGTSWWGSGWPGSVARLLLAVVLGYAGLVKMGDLAEAGRVAALYRIVPEDWAQLVGGVLPFVEVALALLLGAGLATRTAAMGAAALFVVYVAAIASVWARGLSIDCGCFGGGGTLSAGAERGYAIDIARDLVLLAAAVLLIRNPRTRYALDRWVLDPKER